MNNERYLVYDPDGNFVNILDLTSILHDHAAYKKQWKEKQQWKTSGIHSLKTSHKKPSKSWSHL